MLVPSTVPVSWCNTACIIRVFVRSSYIWYVYFVSDVTTVQPSGYYMYRTVVTICTASLTYSNSTFCPHNVFMCFVWISEQTAIISLYSINWLICITETECVYCAVRTKCYVIQVYFRSSATLSTTKLTLTSSKSRQFMWDLWCTKWHWDKAPPPQVLRFSSASVIPPMVHIHLRLYAALTRRTNERSLGTFTQQCPFGNEEASDSKVL